MTKSDLPCSHARAMGVLAQHSDTDSAETKEHAKKNMQTCANNIKEHKCKCNRNDGGTKPTRPIQTPMLFQPSSSPQNKAQRTSAKAPQDLSVPKSNFPPPRPEAPAIHVLGVHRCVGRQQHFDHICAAKKRRQVKGRPTSEVRPLGGLRGPAQATGR